MQDCTAEYQPKALESVNTVHSPDGSLRLLKLAKSSAVSNAGGFLRTGRQSWPGDGVVVCILVGSVVALCKVDSGNLSVSIVLGSES